MSVAVAMLVLLYVCLSAVSKVLHRVSSASLALRECFFQNAMVVTERSLNNSSGGGTGPRRGHVGALTSLARRLCRTLAVRDHWQVRRSSGNPQTRTTTTATVLWKSLTPD